MNKMKTLTTILVLFSLSLYGQTYHEELCNGSTLSMQFKDDYTVHLGCDDVDFNEVDFFESTVTITNVLSTTGNHAVLKIDSTKFKYKYLVTYDIESVIDNFLCPDTIFKDTLSEITTGTGIRVGTSSIITFKDFTTDTIEVVGLGIYLGDEDFETGTVLEFLPTIKTDVVNSFIHTPIKVKQLVRTGRYKTETWGVFEVYCSPREEILEWIELDITKYKEVFFIEKPK